MKKSTKTGRPSDRQTQNGSAEGARKKKKSNKLSTAILLIAFSIGLVLCLYPTVSDRWNAIHQSKAIAAYTEFVADMDEDEYGHILERAHAYNEKIKNRLSEYFPTDEEMEEYYSCLDVTGTGIMGYVQIDKINVKLPIYHGTEDTVLQVATGHLDWTSLPVGGEGTHCVISGHRGLPSAKLFTDLDKLEPGDIFTIRVLNELYTYEIDQILIVLPTDTEELKIKEGEDYVTLLTCTPYGVNSHRMFVRGKRIENIEKTPTVNIINDAVRIEPLYVAVVIIVPVLLALLVFVLVRDKKNSRKLRSAAETKKKLSGSDDPDADGK